jgi:hypothetical protein
MSDTELRDAIFQLSADEATSVLEAMAADFRPARAPLVPSSANEARQRIEELKADPAFLKAYFDGSLDARRQIAALDQLIADASDADVLGGEQMVEVTDGSRMQLPRRHLISAAADMRREGTFNEAGIEFVLSDKKFDTASVYAAQGWVERMEADETKTVMYPDLGGTREEQLRFFKAICAIGDGSRP